LVSAALGSFVVFSDPSDPASARVGYELSRRTLSIERLAQSPSIPGLKVALSESTEVLSAIYQPERGCIEPDCSAVAMPTRCRYYGAALSWLPAPPPFSTGRWSMLPSCRSLAGGEVHRMGNICIARTPQ
ncbi:MAG: hypothetical protein ACYCV1_13900, partial [Acidimicrobiales bacterium]